MEVRHETDQYLGFDSMCVPPFPGVLELECEGRTVQNVWIVVVNSDALT